MHEDENLMHFLMLTRAHLVAPANRTVAEIGVPGGECEVIYGMVMQPSCVATGVQDSSIKKQPQVRVTRKRSLELVPVKDFVPKIRQQLHQRHRCPGCTFQHILYAPSGATFSM